MTIAGSLIEGTAPQYHLGFELEAQIKNAETSQQKQTQTLGYLCVLDTTARCEILISCIRHLMLMRSARC